MVGVLMWRSSHGKPRGARGGRFIGSIDAESRRIHPPRKHPSWINYFAHEEQVERPHAGSRNTNRVQARPLKPSAMSAPYNSQSTVRSRGGFDIKTVN